MATVHVENTVRDFDIWKANFDKFENFRAEQGVQSYRISRRVDEPNYVVVDLEFDGESAARSFLGKLAKIISTPQAQGQLVDHREPLIYTTVFERTVAQPALRA